MPSLVVMPGLQEILKETKIHMPDWLKKILQELGYSNKDAFKYLNDEKKLDIMIDEISDMVKRVVVDLEPRYPELELVLALKYHTSKVILDVNDYRLPSGFIQKLIYIHEFYFKDRRNCCVFDK
jgi:hypothetical protein